MKNKMNIEFKKISIVAILSFVIFIMTIFVGKTYSDNLNNNLKVEEKSELRYYLKVKYDGIDNDKIISSDENTANVKSDKIHVEDKIPEGLTFVGFETTENGSIGAIKRNNSGEFCTGKVIDDTKEESKTEGTWNEDKTEYTYHGLHYNKTTNTVSFDVENLQAGCELTVGIITKTPKLPEGVARKDFYNYATITEDDVAGKSNTVHVYIQNEETELHKVTYTYDETAPTSAPNPPEAMDYAEGAIVGVAGDINVYGYEFLGWKNKDSKVSIVDGQFTMPNEDVELVGSFRKIEETEKYIVKYQINGIKPENYVVPLEKSYDEGKLVTLDSLKPGDIINGYKFLGWESNDVTISEDKQFIMPNKNVTIVGKFEIAKYKVIYKFYDTVLLLDSELYLPATEEYEPGTTVTLKNVLGEPEGYKFLGWYKEDNFVMPDSDVIIYGEWKVQTGTFEPTITKEIVNKKDLYKAGDKIEFKITVTNTASFNITDIIVKENNSNATFKEGNGYDVMSDHIAVIPILKAGKSIKLYSEYVVTTKDEGKIINEVEIKGALAKDDYVLEDKDYKATAEFNAKKSATSNSNSNNNIYDGDFYDEDDTPGSTGGNNNGSNNTVGNNKSSNTNNNNNLTTLDSITKYIVMIVTCLIVILFIIICMKKINKKEA